MSLKLGICDRCKRKNILINWTAKGKDDYWFICGDCWDVAGPINSRPPGVADHGYQHNSNPWQENAIRDLEEDR